MKKKQIIYILGAGRSGTTLLGVVLSNHKQAFDVGELLKFASLRGEPHGFDESSDNYQFWKKVENRFFEKNPQFSYDELISVTKYVESHVFFFNNLLGLINKKKKTIYKKYLNSLYEAVFEISGKNIIVDSSKFAGRALALNKYLEYPVKFIYLVRDPRGTVQSFQKKEVEQPAKSFLGANLYYFIINLISWIVAFIVPSDQIIKVKYEDLVTQPIETIEKIEQKFEMDYGIVKDLILTDQSLKVGFLFEGNRIRLKKNVKLKIAKKQKYNKNFKNIFTKIVNSIWY